MHSLTSKKKKCGKRGRLTCSSAEVGRGQCRGVGLYSVKRRHRDGRIPSAPPQRAVPGRPLVGGSGVWVRSVGERATGRSLPHDRSAGQKSIR